MCRLPRNCGVLKLLKHTGPVIGYCFAFYSLCCRNLTCCLWTGWSLDEALRDRGGSELGSRHHIQHSGQHRYWHDSRHYQPAGATPQHHWAEGQWWRRKYRLVLLTSLSIIYGCRRVCKTPRNATASFHYNCPSFLLSLRLQKLNPTGRIFVMFDIWCFLLKFIDIFRKR